MGHEKCRLAVRLSLPRASLLLHRVPTSEARPHACYHVPRRCPVPTLVGHGRCQGLRLDGLIQVFQIYEMEPSARGTHCCHAAVVLHSEAAPQTAAASGVGPLSRACSCLLHQATRHSHLRHARPKDCELFGMPGLRRPRWCQTGASSVGALECHLHQDDCNSHGCLPSPKAVLHEVCDDPHP